MMKDKITETKIGYKLFEVDKNGILFPLFIGKDKSIPIGEWISAEYIPTKGFAARGGWHIGADVPDAPWLKGYDGSDTGIYRSRFAKRKRVWCEVEYNATINWNKTVETLPKKCFVDKVPENGFYFFREVGKGIWVISSDIKVIRILSEHERQEILLAKGYSEKEAYKRYKETFEKRLCCKNIG